MTNKIMPLAAILVVLVSGAVAAVEVVLTPGEPKTVEGLTIGFDEVRSDGRCPIGLFCFWEGDAACALWARTSSTERSEFVLHTSAMFARQATYAGWTITLQELDPYPVYERPTDPSDYTVTLRLTRDQLTPVEETTWSRIKSLYR